MREAINSPGCAEIGAKTAGRILVVEDDEGLNHLAQKALRRAGYETDGVMTGAEAIERVMTDPDVTLLLDERLPDMNGTQIIHTLIERNRHVSFVAMTGYGNEKIAVEMMKLGAKDYLVKGFDLTDLLPEVFRHVFRDLETEKRLEVAAQDLRDREEKYARLFNCGNDAILVHPVRNGVPEKFIEVNDVACARLGYCREELLRMSPADIDAEGMDDARRRAMETMAETGECVFEMVHVGKSGNKIPVEISGKLFDVAGESYVISIARDITERKRAEEEQERLRAQLRQAEKMEAVGRLAGGVAHDFNNMLGVILGHADIALEKVDPAQPFYADFEAIRKAAERSADLTRQLLAFARKQTVAPEILDLNETVEGMLKMLRRLIGEDINLAWLPGAGLPPVKMDPVQIDQMLANLCVNARDAIAGVGKLTIETGKAAFDQDYCADHAGFVPGEFVLLAVSDDGCGMDGEILENIFEPFFTTKDVGRGTGLGLATVYGIVKQNSGLISVYSEPGKGTTFKIYLPGHIRQAIETQMESPPLILRGCGETVLLVEDEPANLEMGKIVLEGLGYRVLASGSPRVALRLAAEHTGEIHLLVTDVVMPGMNGRELAERLHSLYPSLKCLFMSGYTANVIAHHGVLDAGVHFIQKPFSRKDLAATVRAVLAQK